MAAQDAGEGARWSRETLVDVKKARISSISSELCSMACSFAVAESVGASTALGSCTLAESCSYCRSCLLTNPGGDTCETRCASRPGGLETCSLRFRQLSAQLNGTPSVVSSRRMSQRENDLLGPRCDYHTHKMRVPKMLRSSRGRGVNTSLASSVWLLVDHQTHQL